MVITCLHGKRSYTGIRKPLFLVILCCVKVPECCWQDVVCPAQAAAAAAAVPDSMGSCYSGACLKWRPRAGVPLTHPKLHSCTDSKHSSLVLQDHVFRNTLHLITFSLTMFLCPSIAKRNIYPFLARNMLSSHFWVQKKKGSAFNPEVQKKQWVI